MAVRKGVYILNCPNLILKITTPIMKTNKHFRRTLSCYLVNHLRYLDNLLREKFTMLKWQQVKVSIPYRVHAMSGIIGVYLSKNRNVSIPYRVHVIISLK